MSVTVLDETPCSLGEGPLWHPVLGQLFWFDINRHILFCRIGAATQTWQFDEHVSAAGWVDEARLLVASETKLFLFDLGSGQSETLAALEADNPQTRSNDGRADPWGGFWIGTMGKSAQPGAGAIYRYYRGELRRLYHPITISNAICFSPDRALAYFCDTPTRTIMRQRLEATHGWPDRVPEVWLDLSADGLNPDGAVVDADGNFWNAQWGASRVACYAPDGTFQRAVSFPASQTSCPAFGGPDMSTLFCTSARAGLPADELERAPQNGMTFYAETDTRGQEEHQVIL